jgi:predicted dehydrogenase
MKTFGYGLIGSGFMGKCHTHGMANVMRAFAPPLEPRFELLADIDAASAAKAAKSLGFARWTGDWRELIADPAVDAVSITTPNTLHKPMALAAIAAGKAVWCEKPLAGTPADAKEMADAAKRAGVITIVGFSYLRNPLLGLAREIVSSGEIGEPINFRGLHLADYMASPTTPWSFRLDPAGGHGALGDIGSHIVSLARYMMGEIEEVSGQLSTVIKRRPVAVGAAGPFDAADTSKATATRAVEVDDQAQALLRFANGAIGTIQTSWVAMGRNLKLAFELNGSKGTICLDFERMNELRLYAAGQPKGRAGFKTIFSGPAHPNYQGFIPAAGHHIGFNDLKTIEAKTLIEAMAGGPAAWPDFTDAWRIVQVVEAIAASAREQRWVRAAEM